MSELYINNIDDINEKKFSLIGKNKKILALDECEEFIKNLKKNGCTVTHFSQDLENEKTDSEFNDSMILQNIESLENKKFEIIIINKLEKLKNPTKILRQLQTFLTIDGFFIYIIPNFLFALNRINLLNGDINFQSEELNANLNHFTLDSLLLLLDKVNLKITQLHRIKQKSDPFPTSILNNLSFSKDLIDSILKDPESRTIYYIIKAETGQTISPKLRRYILQTFPKNVVINNIDSKNEYLQKVISDKDQYLQKVISDKDQYLQKVISDKDNLISGLEQTISDKDQYLQKVISDKDQYLQKVISDKDNLISGLEQTISDKDKHISKIIKDYDLQINKIKNSKIWKILRKLDRLRNS